MIQPYEYAAWNTHNYVIKGKMDLYAYIPYTVYRTLDPEDMILPFLCLTLYSTCLTCQRYMATGSSTTLKAKSDTRKIFI